LACRVARWGLFCGVALVMSLRLAAFSILLLPWFMHFISRWLFDERIHHQIRYGMAPRNMCDIYLPAKSSPKGRPLPVVVCVYGGAWIIGHSAWALQLGLRLLDAGVIMVSVDYRNFPQAGVPEMVEDLDRALTWVFRHIGEYGGDPDNVALVGQSAGAHLSALLLVEQALNEAEDGEPQQPWLARRLRAFVGVSGPYDLVALEPHLDARGLYSRVLRHICCGGDLDGCSPERIVSTVPVDRLPPIHLVHGMMDKTVPAGYSESFANALKLAGAQRITLKILEGHTHTTPILEGPMLGQDIIPNEVLPFLFEGDTSKRLPPLQVMCPRWIVDISSVLMPF
jgi:prenylcysteine alpha-carboxyl methylesterase